MFAYPSICSSQVTAASMVILPIPIGRDCAAPTAPIAISPTAIVFTLFTRTKPPETVKLTSTLDASAFPVFLMSAVTPKPFVIVTLNSGSYRILSASKELPLPYYYTLQQ